MYNSRPALNEFPRLLFSSADLPALRARLEHEDCRKAWHRLLAACENRLTPDPAPVVARHIGVPHMAFTALVTGRQDFFEKARELVGPILRRETSFLGERNGFPLRAGLPAGSAMSTLALAYDWLHDMWSAEECRQLRDVMLDDGGRAFLADIASGHPFNERYTTNFISVVAGPMALAALALEADGENTRELFEAALQQIRRALDAQCPDGGYSEGPLYWNYSTRHQIYAAEAARRLKGIDLYGEPFLRNTGDFILQAIDPNLADCFNFADSDSLTKLWPAVAALAAVHRRPDWQWLARELIRHDWGDDGESLEYSLYYLIYYDPEAPATPPATGKAVQLFSGIQQLHMRSGWDRDAIHLAWLNGPANCHHNHLHLNHISMSAFGERLLIDLGYHDPSKRGQCYRFQSAGHNTLLADGAGQVITTDTAIWCKRMRAGYWGTTFGEFRCVREEAGTPIATGSVVNAYPGRLRTFDRTIAFVNRRFFLLHDFIELDKAPPARLEWHFHTGGAVETHPGLAVFIAGAARLAFIPLTDRCTQMSVRTTERERCRPDSPVECLDVQADCPEPSFNLFALLIPYRAGEQPSAELAFENDGVRFSIDGESWLYDPLKRSLLTPEARAGVRG